MNWGLHCRLQIGGWDLGSSIKYFGDFTYTLISQCNVWCLKFEGFQLNLRRLYAVNRKTGCPSSGCQTMSDGNGMSLRIYWHNSFLTNVEKCTGWLNVGFTSLVVNFCQSRDHWSQLLSPRSGLALRSSSLAQQPHLCSWGFPSHIAPSSPRSPYKTSLLLYHLVFRHLAMPLSHLSSRICNNMGLK